VNSYETMKKITIFIGSLIIVMLFSSALSLAAQSYVWVDHAGNTRRTKFPPKQHQVKKWISSGSQKRQKKTGAKVDLYVTSWCPYCHKAREYFRSRNIPVRVYDIEKDKQAAARKQRLAGQSGVPFAVVNGIPIQGYAPERYGQALQKRR